MRSVHLLDQITENMKGAVCAIGNFDGLHQGHQSLIAHTKSIARHQGRPAGVITFEPHTSAVLTPGRPPFRLTLASDKRRLLTDLSLDFLVALPFDEAWARMDADSFIKILLVQSLDIAHLVVGDDFCFGYQRSGTASYLQTVCSSYAFDVSVINPVIVDRLPCSATRVRLALQQGQPRTAAYLLGRWWAIEGIVIPGQKIGRTLGFPTANIQLDTYLNPAAGIYAVTVNLGNTPTGVSSDKQWPGVAYFGHRPTVNGDGVLLEVYLFDFDQDLYGQTIRVAFLDFIRPDQIFDSMSAMQSQIEQDCHAARRLLSDPSFHKVPISVACVLR